MTQDQRFLCTALGFAIVLMHDGMTQEDGAKRARGLAWLIEQFCQMEHGSLENVGDLLGDAPSDMQIDALINNFKKILNDKGEAMLPEDRGSLLRMHKRLEDRSNDKAREHLPSELLADLTLKMIDEEIAEEGDEQ